MLQVDGLGIFLGSCWRERKKILQVRRRGEMFGLRGRERPGRWEADWSGKERII